ncbi:MAG: hypothetical protein VX240_06970 [Actinomycetota bacterium]|nr:hypothetical protein [Actinomycetota bacterium]
MNPGPRERVNGLIAEVNAVSKVLMRERTSYASQLIPVQQYVVVSCIEAFLRYPAAIEVIGAAMSPEEIGARARRPGCQADSVFLWGVANFFLIGRNVMGMVDPSLDTVERTDTVLDFWSRVSRSYRGGGLLHAAAAGNRIDAFDEATQAELAAGVTPVGDERRAVLRRANATLVNHLFLLYFDTRVGHGDTGPYHLADGRQMIVRDFFRMGRSDFWWSGVAADVPHSGLTAALVIDEGVDLSVTDFGTTVSVPEDYLEHLSGFALYTTEGGRLEPVGDDELVATAAAARSAQKAHYRAVVGMDRDEQIACGAYVYFTFLRPFAQIAGVADQIDWTCPRDTPADLYPLVTADIEPPEHDPDADPFPPYEPPDDPPGGN